MIEYPFNEIYKYLMAGLYHPDIYKFEKPINSYWETTADTKNQYNKLKEDIHTNILVIGGGYTGISCALSLSKNIMKKLF